MNDFQPRVRLFATDVDDTILGDTAATQQFKVAWESLEIDRRPLLVYNTGRSVRDVQWLILEGQMPAAEFIIGSLGTEVHDPVDPKVAEEFQASIGAGWDGVAVDQIVHALPDARMQQPEFLSSFKSSWFWPRASGADVARLDARMRAAGLDVTISYTGGIFLDVIPRGAGKGNALAWLCRRNGVSLDEVLVAGASANNSSMFALPGVRGIVVGNASSELFATTGAFRPLIMREKMATGVLAGLSHFGVMEPLAPAVSPTIGRRW
jgi:mannosylfructose-6-phosphate phosphatase